ncbi:hypothetical protein PRZ48_009539 [Zasmidium cellare]|uniref:Uncharacterized protein n=1 Tax=Zasmidium cellare TaxID=395010 RepID=A0ABR0EC05_ZASCE|nr:hypothetical protein PRZ48_009539 [Zasmidium cellare]
MSCPCDDCTVLQKARNNVEKINLLKLCETEDNDNFEIALALSAADMKLKDAQKRMTKKHTTDPKGGGGTSKKVTTSPAKSGGSGGSQDSSSSTLSHGKTKSNSSNGSGSGSAASERGEASTQAVGAGALVLHEKARSGENVNSPAASTVGGTPPPQAAPLAANQRKTSSFTAKDSLMALRLKDSSTPFCKTIAPPGKTNAGFSTPSPSKREFNKSPQHLRQVSNPWAGEDIGPVESSERYEQGVRKIAGELGILRGVNVAEASAELEDSRYAADDTNAENNPFAGEPNRFIVCDHCRAHGLPCNEASVCKECILRLVPCTHRKCDLSPYGKDACPRKVCFYVHADHMPDIYGQHNPNDPNWIVLPGKLRDHLSGGALSRLPHMDQKEILRCYENFEKRQVDAFKGMESLVTKGLATWDTVVLACPCREIEWELQQKKIADEDTRRFEAMARANGIRF